MTINTDLLIAAPMLQDYLVDKDLGTPLAGGIVTMWQDTSRYVTYKNWYYQTGIPGNYTYLPLDNPLSLSSVGTIQDPNGNDVIPFYYPYDENDESIPQPYFVTVYSVDSNGNPAVLQFTRENFPFLPSTPQPSSMTPTLKNLIVNNVYWRNIGAVNLTNITGTIIAPSQHDGYFLNNDITFSKNITGATDNISFMPITSPFPTNDIQPEYSLNFVCSAAQAGETFKGISYPISLHVNTLANVPFTVVIEAQNVAGNVNNQLTLSLGQYLGFGATDQPASIVIQTITLNDNWQKFVIPFTFPPTTGLNLGLGGDDAFFLQIQYPLSVTFSINHTKPSIYLSDAVPDNDFMTYDEIAAIANSPRTGDIRTSINGFAPYGWVPLNDGTIGSLNSGASTRANIDCWPLYALLYLQVSNTYAPVTGGRTGSGNTATDAYADWVANKPIALTKTLSRIIGSIGPGSGLTNWALGQTAGAESEALSIANMPAHSHPGSGMNYQSFNASGGGISAIETPGGVSGVYPVQVASQGSGTAFGIVQPSVFYNMFMKL